MGKYRHIGIKVFIFLLILPFLTITDFYPFMRFGMFAEPIKSNNQLEIFYLGFKKADKVKIVKTDFLGLSEGQFNYLARDYYYKGKTSQLLETFWPKPPLQKDSLFLIKLQGNPSDTIIVGKYSI